MRPLDPLHSLQDRLSSLLGCDPADRDGLVARMLRRDASESAGYWLQISVSAGIALLGVVLGSTAVVIAAMLIAPLMGPILGLGMGLATGSPFLTFRSLGRSVGSVLVVVGLASLLTLALPYHATNPEITGRTAPTVLDLVVAAFCAFAGVYATMRSGSDVAATAAGTAIGISLVPPLCVSGFGLGTRNADTATGAALLFLTNIVAIVFVSTMGFVLAGFNRVKVMQLEQEELKQQGGARVSRALARRLTRILSSRAGSLIRLSMPFLLLAAVYLPLRDGLDDVAWQISTRTSVEASIATLAEPVVDTRLRVERGTIELTLLIIGTPDAGQRVAKELEREIHGRTGANPRIEVVALADAKAFATLETSVLARPPIVREPDPPPSPLVGFDLGAAHVQEIVEKHWPAALGSLLVVSLDLGSAPYRLRLLSLGPAPEQATREVLSGAVAAGLGRDVLLEFEPLSPGWIEPQGNEGEYMGQLSTDLARADRSQQVWACIERPAEGSPRIAWPKAQASLASRVEALVQGRLRVSLTEGKEHRYRFAKASCSETAP